MPSWRETCATCGRLVGGAYIPRGGDGSLVKLPKHNTPAGVPCEGRESR